MPRGGNSAQGSSFDQIAISTTGPDADRYLFTVTETNGNSGRIRFDKQTGVATLIAQLGNGQRFDTARFIPWGRSSDIRPTIPSWSEPARRPRCPEAMFSTHT